MRRTILAGLIFALSAAAQQTVAPTLEPVGSPRGENVSGYNITNAFETGYRFRSVSGDLDKYRSDVNFGNGIRLLSSTLTINSREGHGKYFDELLLTTQGLGNDPYQYSSLRLQKNGLYRYDLIWREDDYYNPALTIAYGFHRMDTTRRMQDHNIVLLPQSSFRLLAGYSRNVQSGPALTTINIGSVRGSEFPLFSDIRRSDDEYRVGAEINLFGLKLALTRAWEYFKDDTTDNAASQPSIDGATLLPVFRRAQPVHGSVGHWRVYLISDRHKRWNASGRFTYAGGRNNFVYDETSPASLRAGSSLLTQSLVFGNARRPVLAANTTFTLFLTDRLLLTNHTSVHHTRIDGDATFRSITAGEALPDFVDFQFLGIRTFTNTATLDFRLNPKIGLYTGYHVAARHIRSIEEAGEEVADQSNTLHAGMFGLRLRPMKALTFNFEGEIGRTNRAIYPVSDKDYHALSARAQYRTRRLFLSASARTFYNFSSVSLSVHSARNRNYSGDASFTATSWLSFDASYAKLHTDTLTGIAYFATGDLVKDRSLYVSNIHTGMLGARLSFKDRATFYGGFSRVQDVGSDYRLPTVIPAFFNAQTYPLTFDSPLARVSLRVTPKIRWNAGYQFYRYRDDVVALQNYRAHTGYTSLSWAF